MTRTESHYTRLSCRCARLGTGHHNLEEILLKTTRTRQHIVALAIYNHQHLVLMCLGELGDLYTRSEQRHPICRCVRLEAPSY
jgi:hypothetical protein